MSLRPLEVHAHQHLHPVLGFDPALADRDGHDCVVVGVRIGEQQVELVRTQLPGEGRTFLDDLLLELLVVLRKLLELDEVASPPLEAGPRGDQVAMLAGLSGLLACAARVVPGARLRQLCV